MGASSSAGENRKKEKKVELEYEEEGEEEEEKEKEDGEKNMENDIQDLEKKEKELEKETEKIIETINELNNKLESKRIKLIKIKKRLKYLKGKRQNPVKIVERRKNKKINNVLKQMSIFGRTAKNQIQKDKNRYPERYINTSKALKMESKDPGLFALALLSKHLENLGIETAIEKDENPKEQNNDLTGLQFIFNGMINRKKYDLHFDFG